MNISQEKRRVVMSRNRKTNTKPELVVRQFLFANGVRFNIHVRELPGTPDIVILKSKTVIFVNGCFWHGHENCQLFSTPKSNTDYWENKIRKTKDRDARCISDLMKLGWNILTVWECDLLEPHKNDTLSQLLNSVRNL